MKFTHLICLLMVVFSCSSCGGSPIVLNNSPAATVTKPPTAQTNHIQQASTSTRLLDKHTIRLYKKGGGSVEIDRRGDSLFVLLNKEGGYSKPISLAKGPREVAPHIWVNPDATVNYVTAEVHFSQYIYFTQPEEGYGPWTVHPMDGRPITATVEIEDRSDGTFITLQVNNNGSVSKKMGVLLGCGPSCAVNVEEIPMNEGGEVAVAFNVSEKPKGQIHFPLDWRLTLPNQTEPLN